MFYILSFPYIDILMTLMLCRYVGGFFVSGKVSCLFDPILCDCISVQSLMVFDLIFVLIYLYVIYVAFKFIHEKYVD